MYTHSQFFAQYFFDRPANNLVVGHRAQTHPRAFSQQRKRHLLGFKFHKHVLVRSPVLAVETFKLSQCLQVPQLPGVRVFAVTVFIVAVKQCVLLRFRVVNNHVLVKLDV